MASLPADVQDLNALLKPRRKVRFGEVTYQVPGDMPMEVYLSLELGMNDETSEADTGRLLKSAFIDLLAFYDIDNMPLRSQIEADMRGMSLGQILLLCNSIYRQEKEVEEGEVEGKLSSEVESTTEVETPTTTGTSSSEPSPTPNSPAVVVTEDTGSE